MYAGCLDMTITDRLELAAVEYAPIPVIFSPDDNEWLIYTTDGNDYLRRNNDYVRCDCHDAIWHYSELRILPGYNPRDGWTEYLVCDFESE